MSIFEWKTARTVLLCNIYFMYLRVCVGCMCVSQISHESIVGSVLCIITCIFYNVYILEYDLVPVYSLLYGG